MTPTDHLDPKLKEAYERVMGVAVGASPETKHIAHNAKKEEKSHVTIIENPHGNNSFKTIGIIIVVAIGLAVYTFIWAKVLGVNL